MRSDVFIGAASKVTRKWTKQRKREERNSMAIMNRRHYSTRVTCTEVADDVIRRGYSHASGNGKYTVSKRQMYYACRKLFQSETSKELDAGYFNNVLLRRFVNQNDLDWKITADPRGTLILPNTSHEVRIPVGTIQMDRHLAERGREFGNLEGLDATIPIQWPSVAEGQRYAAVLYIEKEGFEPLLREARIAERYDLAIMSCKGQSVAAGRRFVDIVCAVGSGVPLFIVHDFDKSGFEIAECLTTESAAAQEADLVAYQFQNAINFVDFGLRLEDIDEYSLASETCTCNGSRWPKAVTKAEREFLKAGRRVELNAFTAPQFVEWLEDKLKKHLPERLIPEDDILESAYRRARAVKSINEAVINAQEAAINEAEDAIVPTDLGDKVRERMKSTGEPWDVALYWLGGCDD